MRCGADIDTLPAATRAVVRRLQQQEEQAAAEAAYDENVRKFLACVRSLRAEHGSGS